MRLHAIVLAGGRARRLGGIDKVMTSVGGQTLLSRAISAVAETDQVVVVGPERDADLPHVVRWAREDPPFGGPAAAVAAGLAALDPDPADDVIVLPADLVHPDRAVAALSTTGSVLVDPDGRRQWACVRVRAALLADELSGAGDVSGLALRRLFGRLDLVEVTVPHEVCADLDTPDDLQEHADEHR